MGGTWFLILQADPIARSISVSNPSGAKKSNNFLLLNQQDGFLVDGGRQRLKCFRGKHIYSTQGCAALVKNFLAPRRNI